MGKDFIMVKGNGYSLKAVYERLQNREVTEASEMFYFAKKPKLAAIEEIGIGTDGTDKCLITLKDGGFLVVAGVTELATDYD